MYTYNLREALESTEFYKSIHNSITALTNRMPEKIRTLPKKVPTPVYLAAGVGLGALVAEQVGTRVVSVVQEQELQAQLTSIREVMESWAWLETLPDGNKFDITLDPTCQTRSDRSIIFWEAVDEQSGKTNPERYCMVFGTSKDMRGNRHSALFLVELDKENNAQAFFLSDKSEDRGNVTWIPLLDSSGNEVGGLEQNKFIQIPEQGQGTLATLVMKEVIATPAPPEYPFPGTIITKARLQIQGTLTQQDWAKYQENLKEFLRPVGEVQAQGLPTGTATAESIATATATVTAKPTETPTAKPEVTLTLSPDWQNVEVVKANIREWNFFSSQEYNDQALALYNAGKTAQIPDTAQWINWQQPDFSTDVYFTNKYGLNAFFELSGIDYSQGTYKDRTKLPFMVLDIAHTPLDGDDGYYSATYAWEGLDQIPHIVKRVAYIGDYSSLKELLADLANQDPNKLPFPQYIPNANNCPTDPLVPNPGQAYCDYYAPRHDSVMAKMLGWGNTKNVPNNLFEPLYFWSKGL